MRILHLIIDHQVVERTLGVYESLFPGCNEVVIFNQGSGLKHIKKYSDCIQVDRKTVRAIGKTFDFSRFDNIVAHYLTFEMIDFIDYAPRNIKVCWEIYGYDLYNQFLEPLGYKLQLVDGKKYESKKVRFLNKLGIRGLYLYLRSGNGICFAPIRNNYFKRITTRISSIAVCCSGDAKVLEKYSGRRFDVFKSNNYSLHETLGDLYGAPFNQERGILIGNSASLSNNHLYVLDIIKGFNLLNTSIIMPLSYGGVPQYKEEVMYEYKKNFPNQVSFLLDYMPLHEYNKIFQKLDVMVLSSWRQESIGTIMMGFYLGVKVYMSYRSPLFHSLKEEGFFVYEIEEADASSFITPMKKEQKEHNRSLLLERYSEKAFEDELKRQFA